MDNSNVYDMKLFRERFKEIYKENKYNFPINDNRLNNIISSWKQSSNKFNKNTIFENEADYKGKHILKEYKLFYQHEHKKQKLIKNEYIIWSNSENIMRIGKSKILFIDSTFHQPPDFELLLILMYKDYIKYEKIVVMYL